MLSVRLVRRVGVKHTWMRVEGFTPPSIRTTQNFRLILEESGSTRGARLPSWIAPERDSSAREAGPASRIPVAHALSPNSLGPLCESTGDSLFFSKFEILRFGPRFLKDFDSPFFGKKSTAGAKASFFLA